ncbi:MAG TPA: hypothetical protein VL993_19500 [Stellaceae bacterium]|nr:hypothetical protein [Stellaceae bacterium]
MSVEDSGERPPVDQRMLLPVLLAVLALFLLVAFQTIGLFRDHDTLITVRASQETTVAEGTKLRQQLGAIAGQTAELANAGDPVAKDVVDEMRKQGFTLSSPAATPPAPAPAKQ